MRRTPSDLEPAAWDWKDSENSDTNSGTKDECALQPKVGLEPAAARPGAEPLTAGAPVADMSTSITMGPSSFSGTKRGLLRPGHAASPFGRAPMLAACALVCFTMILGYQHYNNALQRTQLQEELAFTKQKYKLLEQEKRELNVKNEAMQVDHESLRSEKSAIAEKQKALENEKESLQNQINELNNAKSKLEEDMNEKVQKAVRNQTELETRMNEESIRLQKELVQCHDNISSLLEQLATSVQKTETKPEEIKAIPPLRNDDRDNTEQPAGDAEKAGQAGAVEQSDASKLSAPDNQPESANGAQQGESGEQQAAGQQEAPRPAFASDKVLDDGSPAVQQKPDAAAAAGNRPLEFVRSGASDTITFTNRHSGDADKPVVFAREDTEGTKNVDFVL